jgi:hypothetical protein
VVAESFCSNLLNPKLLLLGQMMTAWLAPIFDEQLVVWMHDPEQTMCEWDTALKYGTVTRDEYRQQVLGLAPLPGGSGPCCRPA